MIELLMVTRKASPLFYFLGVCLHFIGVLLTHISPLDAQTSPPKIRLSAPGKTLPPVVGLIETPRNPAKPISARSLLYGVNVIWTPDEGAEGWDRDGGRNARQWIALMKLAGATNTCVPVRWAEIEKARGKYDWRDVDRLVGLLNAAGLTVTGLVETTPDWATDLSSDTRKLFDQNEMSGLLNHQPPNAGFYTDWARFSAAVATHFRNLIRRWEVYSEPDGRGMPLVEHDATGNPTAIRSGGGPVIYARLLKIFAQNVKKKEPDSLIALGGLSAQGTNFLEAVYANGGRTAFDAVALHPECSAQGLAFDWIDACRRVVIAHGDAGKGFWLTAWGWKTYPEEPNGIAKGQQAEMLRETMQGIRRRPFIVQADWRSLCDWRAREKEPLSLRGDGLCTREQRLKPSFAAFQRDARSIPAARPPKRVSLTVPLSREAEEHPARLEVDWNASVGGFPNVWLGAAAEEPFPAKWDAIGRRLKAAGANWIRFNPFRTGLVTGGSNGSTRADFARLDRLLQTAASANINVLLDVSAIKGQNPEIVAQTLRSVAQRYGQGAPYSVFRWEFEGSAAEAKENYAPFVQALAGVVSDRPIGFKLSEGDPVDGIKVIASICNARQLPLNSFSWMVTGSPAEAALTMRRIRAALSHYPALKGTTLLPVISKAENGNINALVSLVSRMVDYAPLEQPNGLLGILSPLDAAVTEDGTVLSYGAALSLLNRLGGVRLEAQSDNTGVRCIATKMAGRVRLLVWREDQEKNSLLCLLHLHGIPGNGSLRMQKTSVIASSGAVSEIEVQSGSEGSNYRSSGLSTEATADIKGENGEMELSLPLEADTVSLITLQPQPQPPLELSLSTNRAQWYFGETLDLNVVVRNTTRTHKKVDVELLAGELSPTNGLKGSLGILPPGGVQRLRFQARVASSREGTAFLNVQASDDCRAALAVRIVSPVSVILLTPRVDLDSVNATAQARIRLLNRTHDLISVHLKPLNKHRAEGEQVIILGDGKPVEHSVALSAPFREAGCYPVEIAVEGAGGRLASLTTLIGVPIACRYATLKPAIDGDLSEWTDSEPMGMGRAEQVHDKVWRGPTDLSGYAYVRWDEQFLYVACAVTDDVFFAPFAAPEMWRGDSVQFALSADRNASLTSSGYGAGDHEFGMGLLDGGHPVLYRFNGPDGTRVGIMQKGAVAVRRIGTRTFYEAAVPWSELTPAKPKEGETYGFSILINDNDGQGRGYISWSHGLTPEKRPLLFPPMKLVR